MATFVSYLGNTAKECIKSKWVPYLYDLAFQKYVISKAYPNYKVKAHLILANKSSKASIEGLNQLFQIEKVNGRPTIRVAENLKASQLGQSILVKKNLDDLVEKIWNVYPMPTTYGVDNKFEDYVKLCEQTYVNDQRIYAPISSKCKGCSYYTKPGKDTGKKSGFVECWKQHTKLSDDILINQPLITDLWQGRINDLFVSGPYLLGKVPQEMLFSSPKKSKEPIEVINGLTTSERRILQVQKEHDKDASYYFDKAGFNEEYNTWKFPLNMIDFETSQVALPFHKDTGPYQGIAFQFSHHKIYQDGRIEHYNQFLHFEKGVYPNLEFIRALKKSLAADEGSIFRYHNHENTYLRMIHKQLNNGECVTNETEKKELCDFIDHITSYKSIENPKSKISGSRNMIDLYEIVKRFYYSPSSRGKIGLKFTLPAIISDSSYLRDKYVKKGIYGQNLAVKSLNFEDHQWIDSAYGNDPYKTLPKIFDGLTREELDELQNDIDGIADGGAALTAYNYLQYSKYTDKQRELIRDALLRYCEVDTAAMVFLIEGLKSLK